MAIDKDKTKELIEDVEQLFQVVTKTLPKEGQKFIREKIMDPILKEVKDLVEDSRPPVIFIVGRSGHGKSSLLNALANREVADVGDIKPTTAESIPYEIVFEDRYATWQVVDTRGIFETTRPDGALEYDAVELLKKDIIRYKPDIVLHVVAASELRNLSNDLIAFKEVSDTLEKDSGIDVPTLLVINKVDTLGNPRDWPPEDSSKKLGLIREAVEYMTLDILEAERYGKINSDTVARGVRISDDKYIGVVPICSLEGDLWNIRTLSDIVGENIPDEARMDYYQAQHRKDQLRKISSSIINKFAAIAGTIGLSPVPVADMVVLTPIQILMIAIVGGLSCREFNKDTAHEFLGAAGINLGAAFGFRAIAQQLVKIIPGAGGAISAGVAASGTYAIGKSAEAYFFSGEIKNPEEFKGEWRKNK